MYASYAEQIAGSVQHAVFYMHIVNINAGNTIIPGFKEAFFDQYVFTTMQMNPIGTCKTGYTLHFHIRTVIDLVQKIAAVLHRVSLQ